MTANKQALKDEDGSSSDWVELHNTGTDTVSLGVRALLVGPKCGQARSIALCASRLPAHAPASPFFLLPACRATS